MNKQDKKDEIEVANYFVVALKILDFKENEKRVWFSKLVESFDEVPEISRKTVAKSLDTLEDWLLVDSGYGKTTPGHVIFLNKRTPFYSRCFFILQVYCNNGFMYL